MQTKAQHAGLGTQRHAHAIQWLPPHQPTHRKAILTPTYLPHKPANMGYFWDFRPASAIARPAPPLISTTIHTLLNSTPLIDMPPSATPLVFPEGTLFPRIKALFPILAITLPILWTYTKPRAKHNWRVSGTKALDLRIWRQVWRTDCWATLYGLIGLANDNKWTDNNPFWGYPRVYPVWQAHNRPWCKRLLALGIIPLFVQDGGMSTYRVPLTGWRWSRYFPFFKWPRYAQGKKRAYMEFLVPYPDEGRMAEFLDELWDNRQVREEMVCEQKTFGVVARYGPPDNGRIEVSRLNPPLGAHIPLEVGASSWFEPLLPFKWDRALKKGFGNDVSSFSHYVRDGDLLRVPLLKYVPHVVVRLEAKHFGPQELDHFVFAIAQENGLHVKWPGVYCREMALAEINRWGLSPNVLPLQFSVPNRYL